MTRTHAMIGAMLLMLSAHAGAQTITNPSQLIFTASPDHAATDMGVQVVSSYAVDWIVSGQSNAAQTINIGKPAPTATGDITVDLSAMRQALTVSPGTYVLRVTAIGPGGSANSGVSVPFVMRARAPTAPGQPRLQTSSAQQLKDQGAKLSMSRSRSVTDVGTLFIKQLNGFDANK